MEVRWFEESAASVPSDDRWLSPGECRCLEAFRFAKRRGDWRLGRWTAKCAVAASIDRPPPLHDIEILPARSGAPEVVCSGTPLRRSISISHREGVACCVIAPLLLSLGCDLEWIETRSAAFLASYFTAEEEQMFRGLPADKLSSVATLLWSAKESVLKALHTGLRADTRSVPVTAEGIGAFGWQLFSARHSAGVLYGRWSVSGGFVRTVACDRQFVLRQAVCAAAATSW